MNAPTREQMTKLSHLANATGYSFAIPTTEAEAAEAIKALGRRYWTKKKRAARRDGNYFGGHTFRKKSRR